MSVVRKAYSVGSCGKVGEVNENVSHGLCVVSANGRERNARASRRQGIRTD